MPALFSSNICCGLGNWIAIRSGIVVASGGNVWNEGKYIIRHCGPDQPPANGIAVPCENGDYDLVNNEWIRVDNPWWIFNVPDSIQMQVARANANL